MTVSPTARYGFNSPLPYYPTMNAHGVPAGGIFSSEFVEALDSMAALGLKVQIDIRSA